MISPYKSAEKEISSTTIPVNDKTRVIGSVPFNNTFNNIPTLLIHTLGTG